MRHALHVPNFADPLELLEMGMAAEASAWDGFFLWDHLFAGTSFPVPMVDPWPVLGALAVHTRRIRLGTAVTPLARRRPQKVAREAVTIDHLSNGRMVLGVGLGNPVHDEYGSFGEPTDSRAIADKLDEALEVLLGLWSTQPFDHEGPNFTVRAVQFLPGPVQQPRIPIWVACGAGQRRPLRRAARFDGVVLADMSDGGEVSPVGAPDLESALREIDGQRGGLDGFEVAVVSNGLPTQGLVERYVTLGVTWLLVTGWIDQLREMAKHPPATYTW